ncbi:MAG TPA: hypothetical protein VFB81_08725, partial [Myxococcales bacterium]|nr:hypothetical protein [Myxococcales bacterium]
MTPRARMAIAAVVAMAVAVFLGTALVLDDPRWVRLVFDAGGWAGSLFGAFGTVAAARTFARGDYLRRVWTLIAAGAALLLAGHAVRSIWGYAMPDVAFNDSPLVYPRFFIVTAANVCGVWGLALLAYSYAHSGIEVPRSAAFNAAWLAVSAVAAALVVHQLRLDVGGVDSVHKFFLKLTNIVSTLADAASFVLIAPVLRVAYLMRGGRLAGAWWAIGLSGALWLIYDC